MVITEKSRDIIKEVKDTLENSKGDQGRVYALMGEKDRERVFIRGLDAVSTKEEVAEAIQNVIKEPSGMVEIGDLRPAARNTKVVNINLNIKDARELLKQGTIKIGISRCWIEKRHEIKRCRRFWGYNHDDAVCKETDRRLLCYKCSKPGHKAKECDSEESYPMCTQEGHRAGTGRCPLFRRQLSIARREDRKGQKATRDGMESSRTAEQIIQLLNV